jgi:hypothetical protein
LALVNRPAIWKLAVGELGKVCRKKHSKSLLFRPSSLLACRGFKALGQASRVVQRAVHGVEQRQIAQLRTAVNVALRKDVASSHHHCFRLTSGL